MNCADNYPKCKAMCCRFLVFHRKKITPEFWDYYKDHKGTIVKRVYNGYLVIVDAPCKHLVHDKCIKYADRPKMCREGYIKEKMKILWVPHCIYKKPPLAPEITEEEIHEIYGRPNHYGQFGRMTKNKRKEQLNEEM